MPDLLVRGLSEETKRCLSERAARNGRSVQAETKDILERAAGRRPSGWVQVLANAARGAEEEGFVLPERRAPRAFSWE